MVSLLLPIIYTAFISLGLPDSLLGSAWPSMYPVLGVPVSYAGLISMIISSYYKRVVFIDRSPAVCYTVWDAVDW